MVFAILVMPYMVETAMERVFASGASGEPTLRSTRPWPVKGSRACFQVSVGGRPESTMSQVALRARQGAKRGELVLGSNHERALMQR